MITMTREKSALAVVAVVSICACLAGCGGGSSSKTNTIAQSGGNVAAITANGGPAGNYANGIFTSVTVCVPGTSTCQPINGVLVDTGSTGLRILSSALTISLPQQKASDGNPVAECLQFLASFVWGPVETADVQIAGEKASSVNVHVLSDTAFPVPSHCSSIGPSADTLAGLGANGILGVGLLAQDCGTADCPASANMYYECPAAGCTTVSQSLAQQVSNPVAMFGSDNNGVIIQLPAVSGGTTSVSGSLVFGIGTQSNNGLGSATVYTTDNFLNFTTTYNGQSYGNSFIDSGSNAYFFLSSSTTGIPGCPSPEMGFYCPASTDNLSAKNQGTNSASATVNFSVGNAGSLFANPNDFAFGDLGGPGVGSFQSEFDWGLPFFYGRNVYTAIVGKSTPGGPGPYWAY